MTITKASRHQRTKPVDAISPGSDTPHQRILYDVRHQIAMPLHVIFETSNNIGLNPRESKFANTVRKEAKLKQVIIDQLAAGLTNVVCKVMKSIIRDHVMKYFGDNDFLVRNN